MTDCPLVLIEWEDSAQPVPVWAYVQDIECKPAVQCSSVGWLLHDNDKVKTIAPNMGEIGSENSLQASGVLRIPTSCVTRIVRLSEVA